MGGPKKEDYNRQTDIMAQQTEIGKKSAATAEREYQRMLELTAPAIELNKAFTSGDREKAMAFAAPVIGQVTKGAEDVRKQIMEDLPPGPARDFALAQLSTEKYVGTTKAMTEPYIASFDKLANIGSGFGSFSLNELGAGLRGFEGASISADSVIKNKAAAKAATMGAIGSVAGAGAYGLAARK